MFDIGDIRVFVRIADVGRISGAARLMGMPKSSVSRSLARLEESIGASLIERSTRHLRLTDAGLLLQRHARRILDDVGEAENAIGGLVGVPQGTLRISVPFTFAEGPMAAMLPAFLQRFPDVRVALTIDNRVIDLLAEEYDIAIRIGPLRDSELIARRIATFALWTCASPDYLAKRGTPVTVAQLLGHEIISRVDRASSWNFKMPEGKTKSFELASGTVIPEPAVLKKVLIGGSGIGRLPDFHARDALANGSLVRLFADHQEESVDAHALYPSHRSLSAKVRVFIDALIEHFNPKLKGSPSSRYATH